MKYQAEITKKAKNKEDNQYVMVEDVIKEEHVISKKRKEKTLPSYAPKIPFQ